MKTAWVIYKIVELHLVKYTLHLGCLACVLIGAVGGVLLFISRSWLGYFKDCVRSYMNSNANNFND